MTLAINGSLPPEAGHLIGTVAVQGGHAVFTFCGGGSWRLEGGPAYSELVELYSESKKKGETPFVVTLAVKGKRRIDLSKNPGVGYWAVASVEQVIGMHESTSC